MGLIRAAYPCGQIASNAISPGARVPAAVGAACRLANHRGNDDTVGGYSLLALGGCARSGSLWRVVLAALAVVLLVSGCASSSGQASGGAADPAGSASPTAAKGCGHDEAMGRPCPPGTADAVSSHRPRYKTDQGEDYESYNRDTYHGQSGGYCKPRLKESYQAYKACVRY
jgi:hypothetical protein